MTFSSSFSFSYFQENNFNDPILLQATGWKCNINRQCIVMLCFNRKSPSFTGRFSSLFVGAFCSEGYRDTARQLKCWSGQFSNKLSAINFCILSFLPNISPHHPISPFWLLIGRANFFYG
jgi:hypothetical protein